MLKKVKRYEYEIIGKEDTKNRDTFNIVQFKNHYKALCLLGITILLNRLFREVKVFKVTKDNRYNNTVWYRISSKGAKGKTIKVEIKNKYLLKFLNNI